MAIGAILSLIVLILCIGWLQTTTTVLWPERTYWSETAKHALYIWNQIAPSHRTSFVQAVSNTHTVRGTVLEKLTSSSQASSLESLVRNWVLRAQLTVSSIKLSESSRIWRWLLSPMAPGSGKECCA